MKINISGENLMKPMMDTINKTPKMFQTTPFAKGDMYPIKLAVSKEGKEALRDHRQDGAMTDYEALLERRQKIMEMQGNGIKNFGCGGFLYSEKFNEIKGRNGDFGSLEDEGYACLEAYANAYNEIIEGYANGTRERYVEDENSETGYRKVTQEEELRLLDDAFQKHAEYIEYWKPKTAEARETIYQYQQELSKLSGNRADDEEQVNETLERIRKAKDLPDNIAEDMLTAKQKMIAMFSKNSLLNVNMDILRKNIQIF